MKLMFAFLVVSLCSLAAAQEMVQEPSTEKNFPAEITVQNESTSYTLQLTGLAVRKKFFFKVYGIAHYLQDAMKMSEEEAYKACLTDGKAKQITMDFSRDVGVDKITDSYKEAFEENATKEELAAVQPSLKQFLGYFTKEVKENEQYVLRWFPGGTVVSIVQGEEKPAITDTTFARILWSIWLGPNSVVDRDDLVSRITK